MQFPKIYLLLDNATWNKNEFMDVGDSAEINGLTITLIDSSEASESATIQVAC
jgi:hypothetical protein